MNARGTAAGTLSRRIADAADEIGESGIAAQFVELRIDVAPREKCVVLGVCPFQPQDRRIAIAERRMYNRDQVITLVRTPRGVFQRPEDGERVGPAPCAGVACGQERRPQRIATVDHLAAESDGEVVVAGEAVGACEVELREGRIPTLFDGALQHLDRLVESSRIRQHEPEAGHVLERQRIERDRATDLGDRLVVPAARAQGLAVPRANRRVGLIERQRPLVLTGALRPVPLVIEVEPAERGMRVGGTVVEGDRLIRRRAVRR